MVKPEKTRIIFVTRKYPPQVGGMENLSYNLTNFYPGEKTIIALRNKQIHLLWFIPYAIVRSLISLRGVETVHLGDPVLAIVGFFINTLSPKKTFVEVHGLDIIFSFYFLEKNPLKKLIRRIYHLYLKLFLSKGWSYICISRATEELVKQLGIKNTKVIQPGINCQEVTANYSQREELEKKYPVNFEENFVILTVSRLIKKKGAYWFIANVIPKLGYPNLKYVVVGDGEDKERIQTLISKIGL